MRELPILFNQDMVRALLDGRKTQTRRRRPCKNIEGDNFVCGRGRGYKVVAKIKNDCIVWTPYGGAKEQPMPMSEIVKSARYQLGDLLYVRERCRCHKCFLDSDAVAWWQYEFEADGKIANWIVLPDRMKFKPGIGHCIPNGCFKELARIWLKVTDVRVETIQDISLEDIHKEGVPETDHRGVGHMRDKWQELWQSCYPGSWERNDWVWVYTFERVEK
jgi:hypothetical protein